MNKSIVMVLSASILMAATGFAQDHTVLAKSMPQLESLLSVHLGTQSSFKGRMEIKVTPSDGRAPFIMPAMVHFSDNKIRCELLSDSGSKSSSKDGAVFIFDAIKRELLVADTEQRTYREVRMSPSALDAFAAEKQETRLSLVPVGTDTLKGQAVTKAKGSLKRDGREVGQSTVWHTKVGGVQVPVQIETCDTNQVTTLTFSEVQVGGVEAGKFQVPATYRKVTEWFSNPGQ